MKRYSGGGSLNVFDVFVEIAVETLEHRLPFQFTTGNFVEFLLYIGRELIVDNAGEILHQKIADNDAGVGGEQFCFLGTKIFFATRFGNLLGLKGKLDKRAFHAGSILLSNVPTVDDC